MDLKVKNIAVNPMVIVIKGMGFNFEIGVWFQNWLTNWLPISQLIWSIKLVLEKVDLPKHFEFLILNDDKLSQKRVDLS